MADELKQLAVACRIKELAVVDGATPEAPVSFAAVKVISIGEAKGHGVQVDVTTLQNVVALTDTSTRIRAYLTHGYGTHEDRLGQEIGCFESFRLDGDDVRADFRFLTSFQRHEPALYAKLVELAREMPESFGVSVACQCFAVWVLDDGTEVPTKSYNEAAPEGAVSPMPALRITELRSADLVDFPAATDGLFSGNTTHKTTHQTMAENNEKLLELQTKVADLNETVAAKDKEIEQLKAANIALDAKVQTTEADTLKIAGQYFEIGELHAKVNGVQIAIAALKAGQDLDTFQGELLKAYSAGSQSNGGMTPDDDTPARVIEAPTDAAQVSQSLAVLRAQGRHAEANQYYRKHRKLLVSND